MLNDKNWYNHSFQTCLLIVSTIHLIENLGFIIEQAGAELGQAQVKKGVVDEVLAEA